MTGIDSMHQTIYHFNAVRFLRLNYIGYYGNGSRMGCRRYCDRRPCFQGVRCYNTATAFRCGRCPEGAFLATIPYQLLTRHNHSA